MVKISQKEIDDRCRFFIEILTGRYKVFFI